MEIQASRAKARTGPSGEPILLLEQNRALGPFADTPRLCRTRARRGTGRRAGALCAAGRDRRLPCARAHGRRHRLGAHRRALRRAGAARALAGGGAQPRRGAGHGLRPGHGAGGGRRAAGRALDEKLPPAAQRARRLPVQAGTPRKRPMPNSNAPPRSRATCANASCCWRVPRPVCRTPRRAWAELQPAGLRPPSMQAMAASCSSTVAPK